LITEGVLKTRSDINICVGESEVRGGESRLYGLPRRCFRTQIWARSTITS